MSSAGVYDVVVVGGGPAGVTAALRARELGATVALVERNNLGGTCTNDGCVPTRVLAKAARLVRDVAQFREYGLSPIAPELDFARLIARTQHIVYAVHEKKQLLANLEASGVDVRLGEARFVDAGALQAGADVLQAGAFILCAGGRARRLDFPGAQHALTHSDVWTLQALPKSIAIVGGAATGCQLASIFAAFGTRVTILDVAPRLVPAEDEIISRTLTAAFIERGIRLVTGIQGLDRIEKHGAVTRLFYRHADGVQQLDAAAVLLSTGWLGNLDGLNLAAAGVETDGRYVRVDEHLRTTAPGVFAAGDITGRMMLVQSAGYEARIAAENAVLGGARRYRHEVVPHGGFTDPEYGSVGLSEAAAQAAGARGELRPVVATASYGELDRGVIDGHTEGHCKLIADADSHRLLGAHVAGEQAVEIVHVVAAGMAAGMTVEQLAELEVAYPTYTAVLSLAARRLARDLGIVSLSPAWRALGPARAAEWERRDGAPDPGGA